MPSSRSKTRSIRMGFTTDGILTDIAKRLGYAYSGKGSLGKLLDAIADGEVKLVKEVQHIRKDNK